MVYTGWRTYNSWDHSMNHMNMTLHQLLRLGLAQNYTWLSEKPDPSPRVKWVVSAVDQVQPGDVLLIAGQDLTHGILKKTQEYGAAALVLIGAPPTGVTSTPPAFPVVSLPQGTDHREVHRSFLNILVNQRTYLLERGIRIHARLSKLAAEGEGLAGLAQAMADLSGRGVIIQDKRLGILAEYPSTLLLSIWENVLDLLAEKIQLPEKLSDRKKAGKTDFILRQTLQDGLERIVAPISVGGVARGFLSLIDLDQQLDDLDHLVAEQGALVCAIEMARAKAVREAEKRLKGDLLTALLQENITPRDANLWVQSMGMDLEQAHVALRFAWDAPTPPSMRRLETLLNGEVTRQGVKVLIEVLGSEIVCICQVSASSGRPEEAIQLANAVAEIAKQEFPQVPMRGGIGRQVGNLSLWGDSFRQAGQALEMARRLQVRKPQYFPDLSVDRLLLQLEHHPDLKAFQEEILGLLLAYEGGGDLIKTLEVYFEHNGTVSQAAEALFVHRNTLVYRMERIAEITGLDLENTETRLAVQLALRIYHILNNL